LRASGSISRWTDGSDEPKACAPEKVLSYQANTSSKRPEELDNLSELETEQPERLPI